MKLLNVQDAFFAPLWRRVAIVAVCLGWAVFEFATGTPFWGVLFGAAGVYCAWQFFMVFNPKSDQEEEQEK